MMKNLILKLFLFTFLISCGSKTQKGIIASEINIEILKKVDLLPNPDPKADLSQTDDFEDAFNSHQEQFEFTSLLMTSRRWAVKNDRNGKPINRERIAAITAELDDKCYIQHFIFKQDADGNNFEDSYISEAYGWKSFDCNLLDKK